MLKKLAFANSLHYKYKNENGKNVVQLSQKKTKKMEKAHKAENLGKKVS